MSYLITNLALKSLMLMAAIGIAGLLVSFRILLDLRDMPRNDPNLAKRANVTLMEEVIEQRRAA